MTTVYDSVEPGALILDAQSPIGHVYQLRCYKYTSETENKEIYGNFTGYISKQVIEKIESLRDPQDPTKPKYQISTDEIPALLSRLSIKILVKKDNNPKESMVLHLTNLKLREGLKPVINFSEIPSGYVLKEIEFVAQIEPSP
ncbi:MAG TPA: hypothetical protein VED00_02315 [archaeon]|nr:hypothetical protein [archaeon]